MLPVFVDYPFIIAHSVFSNVYLQDLIGEESPYLRWERGCLETLTIDVSIEVRINISGVKPMVRSK